MELINYSYFISTTGFMNFYHLIYNSVYEKYSIKTKIILKFVQICISIKIYSKSRKIIFNFDTPQDYLILLPCQSFDFPDHTPH